MLSLGGSPSVLMCLLCYKHRSLKVSGFVRTAVPRKRDAAKEDENLSPRKRMRRRRKNNRKNRSKKAKRKKIAMRMKMMPRVNQTAKMTSLSKVKYT